MSTTVKDYLKETLKQATKLGDVVRLARIAKGWTQVQLAEAVPCSQFTISRIEIGMTPNPHRETLEGIARALGNITMDDFEPFLTRSPRKPSRVKLDLRGIQMGPYRLAMSDEGALQVAMENIMFTIQMAG